MTLRLVAGWVGGLAAVYVGGVLIGALVATALGGPASAGPSTKPAGLPTPAGAIAADQTATTSSVPPTVTGSAPSATAVPSAPLPTRVATGSSTTPTIDLPSETPALAPSTTPDRTAAASIAGDDPENLPVFVADLGDALRRGSATFLFDHLHPAVLERYGEKACRGFTSSARVAGLTLEYLQSDGPVPWDWELDGLTTTIADSWTVTVTWIQPGTHEQRDLHLAPSNGLWRWFTDCGDPKTG